MTDVFSNAKRSKIMARIQGAHTRPEMVVRSFLRSRGFHLRLHVKLLPGKPDVVISKCRTVIFINGCFWHHHTRCKRASLPKTRADFWRRKILGNRSRDQRNSATLRRLGWHVITVWQCQLTPGRVARRLNLLLLRLRSASRAGNNPRRD